MSAALVMGAYFAVSLVLGSILDPDTYHYVEYWNKLVGGVRHESSLFEAAPKAVPILAFGLLYDVTGSYLALGALPIVAGAFAVALTSELLESAFGKAGRRISLVLLASQPLFVRQVLDANSVVFEILFLALAARLVHGRAARRGWIVGIPLALAGLSRPEVWPFFLVGLAACAALRRFRWALPAMLVASASPVLWLAFDALLTGDALFSFRDTASYHERHAASAGAVSLARLPFAFGHAACRLLVLILPGASLVLGAVGWLQLRRRHTDGASALLILGASVIAFYLVPFRSGLPLIDRFLTLPAFIATALAGPALWSLVNVAAERAPGHRVAVVGSLVIGASLLHPAQALYSHLNSIGRLFASVTREHILAAEWLRETDAELDERRLICSSRRKGLLVVSGRMDSDQVISFPFFVPANEPPDFLLDLDYILYDLRDLRAPLDDEWCFLDEVPEGFHEIPGPETVSSLRIYRNDSVSSERDQ